MGANFFPNLSSLAVSTYAVGTHANQQFKLRCPHQPTHTHTTNDELLTNQLTSSQHAHDPKPAGTSVQNTMLTPAKAHTKQQKRRWQILAAKVRREAQNAGYSLTGLTTNGPPIRFLASISAGSKLRRKLLQPQVWLGSKHRQFFSQSTNVLPKADA